MSSTDRGGVGREEREESRVESGVEVDDGFEIESGAELDVEQIVSEFAEDMGRGENVEPLLRFVQGLCWLWCIVFYVSLRLSRIGPFDRDPNHNNINSVAQMFESFCVDAVTLLFVVTGFLDMYKGVSYESWVRRVYDININYWGHISCLNVACGMIGLFVTGGYRYAMGWSMNLLSFLYVSPFMEYDQSSPWRLINEPTSILMTFLTCRSLFPLAQYGVDNMQSLTSKHELANIANVLMQMIVGSVVCVWHAHDSYFYFSYRFLLTRLSEYTFGIVCCKYIVQEPGWMRRLAVNRALPWIFLVHALVWLSEIDQVQPEDNTVCARVAPSAPCFTRLDTFVSRAVPLSFAVLCHVVTNSIHHMDDHWFIMLISRNMYHLQVGVIYCFPVAYSMELLMQLLRVERAATVVLLLCLTLLVPVVRWVVTFVNPISVHATDWLLGKIESRMVSFHGIPPGMGRL